MSPLPADAPIGVFDSGMGGLTVLRALMNALPAEEFLYLGDTARLPYGTKSPATVERYALQAGGHLVRRGVKCLVVACNTASAAALPAMQRKFAPLIVVGVVEPGAAAAVAATRSGRIGVLATESTVRGGAYQRALAVLRPDVEVVAVAATVFVALAEEGWVDGAIAAAVAHRYLAPLYAADGPRPDTLVLGCTHFPPLAAVIAREAGEDVTVVDSAATTAAVLRQQLLAAGLGRNAPATAVRFLVTDGAERFQRIGPAFLGAAIARDQIETVDLGG
ncbi:MAG: glutamate racemase [Pseudomonadota bacterium]